MINTGMDVAHEVANILRLKAGTEILKCTDNGLDTKLRLRNESKIFEIKIKVYDLENEKKSLTCGNRESDK